MIIYIDGPGGTGKTLLFNAVLNSVRAEGNYALACATSGIASILLQFGRTIHSRFKVPVKGLNPHSYCVISEKGALCELIKKAKVILLDEAPMGHR